MSFNKLLFGSTTTTTKMQSIVATFLVLSSFLHVDCAVTTSSSSFLDLRPSLKGIALENIPFVSRQNTKGEAIGPSGYLVELLEEVTQNTSFGFSIEFETDAPSHEHILEKVADKKFDFALADLLVSEERRRSVDFTRPILNVTLAALVRKSDFSHSKNLADMVDRTVSRTGVTYGCVRGSNTHRYLSESGNPLARRIWAKIAGAMNENLVNHIFDGVVLVNQGNFILFGESPSALYHAGQECSLRVLLDEGQLEDFRAGHYAIAMQKSGGQLQELNEAIERLEARGGMLRLQQRYWNETDSC